MEEQAMPNWSTDKRVSDVNANQIALAAAVRRHNRACTWLLLDGHFVLLDSEGIFKHLDVDVFRALNLDGVVLIEVDAPTIARQCIPAITRDAGLMRHGDAEGSVFRLEVDFVLRRYGGAAHLVVPQGTRPSPAQVNVGLIRALACARRWYADLVSGEGKSQPRLAKELGVSARYLRKIIPCAFLAPDIVETILDGRQPPELTLARLVDRLSADWDAQRRRLGFTAPYASADCSVRNPAPDATLAHGRVLQ